MVLELDDPKTTKLDDTCNTLQYMDVVCALKQTAQPKSDNEIFLGRFQDGWIQGT